LDKDFKKKISAYARLFKEAQECGKKEADIVMYIVQFLKDALKYDVFREISKEYQIKDKYCDIAIQLDGRVAMLIEAKQPGIKLADRHIEQAENYAMRSGTEWAALTNGCEWRLYHLENTDEGMERALVFKTDLLDSFKQNPEEVLSKFLLLTRKNFVKGELDKYWQKVNLLTPQSLLRAVFTESVLRAVSRELNRREKVRIGFEELERGIKNVLDKGVLAELADLKIKKRRKQTSKRNAKLLKASKAPLSGHEPLPTPSTPDSE